MQNNFTKQAKTIWDSLPEDFQEKVLKSVFCVKCRTAVEIVEYAGVVEDGLLVLDGNCKTCGQAVTRVLD